MEREEPNGLWICLLIMGNSIGSPQIIQNRNNVWSAISSLGPHPNEIKQTSDKDTQTTMFIAALFPRARS